MSHYIAMSGSHGCLPDHCEAFSTLDGAVEDLCATFGLGRIRKARLTAEMYLELVPTIGEDEFGADYCEIAVCECSDPSSHCDSGEYEEEDNEVEEILNSSPEEEDYTISDCGPLGCLTIVNIVGGKCLGTFDDFDSAMRAIKADMDKNQFWPNVWQISDHGNVSLCTDELPSN